MRPVAVEWGRFDRRRPLLAVASALLLLLVAHASTATAAPLTVSDCPGSNWAPPAGATTLSDAQQQQVRSGNSIIVYDSYGGTIDSLIAGGLDPLNDAYPAACVARASGGAIVTEWAYCTDRTRHVCLDQLLPTVTGNPRFAAAQDPLGPAKERVIAYLAEHGYPVRKDTAYQMSPGVLFANSNSAEERTSLQQMIWCVSEAAPGEKTLTTDLKPTDHLGTDTCPNNFNDTDFDAVLALAPAAPSLNVTPQQAGPLPVGAPARFVVTSNVLNIPITVSGAPNLTVCEGTATLTGDQLTIPGIDGFETKQVTLCAPPPPADSAASVTLRVQHPSPTSMSWSWGGNSGCQVFATSHAERPKATTAAASVRVAAPTPVPIEVPTPVEPVTTTKRGKMQLTKTSNRSRVRAGSRVQYRVRVRNTGRISLRNVRVCDRLPAGLVLVKANKNPKRRQGQVCWTVKRLGPGHSATFTMNTRVVRGASGRLTNRATVTSLDASTRTASRTIRVTRSKSKGGGVTG